MGTTQLETVPEPKYWHLKTVLSEALDSEFAVGEILPNERDLAARFGVARATLRQALEQLELEGRLQRRRGVGTTVAPPRVGVAVGTEQHAWPGAAGDAWQPVDCAAGGAARGRGRRPRRPTADAAGAHRAPLPCDPRPARRRRAAVRPRVVGARSSPPSTPRPGAARARAVLRELQRLELEGQDRAVELGSARADDAKELDRLPGAPVLVVTTRYFAGGPHRGGLRRHLPRGHLPADLRGLRRRGDHHDEPRTPPAS